MVLAKDSSPRVWAGSSGARDGVGVTAGSRDRGAGYNGAGFLAGAQPVLRDQEGRPG